MAWLPRHRCLNRGTQQKRFVWANECFGDFEGVTNRRFGSLVVLICPEIWATPPEVSQLDPENWCSKKRSCFLLGPLAPIFRAELLNIRGVLKLKLTHKLNSPGCQSSLSDDIIYTFCPLELLQFKKPSNLYIRDSWRLSWPTFELGLPVSFVFQKIIRFPTFRLWKTSTNPSICNKAPVAWWPRRPIRQEARADLGWNKALLRACRLTSQLAGRCYPNGQMVILI